MIDPYILKNISQYPLPYKTNTRIINGLEFEITYDKSSDESPGRPPLQKVDIYVNIITPIDLKGVSSNKTLKFSPVEFKVSYPPDLNVVLIETGGIVCTLCSTHVGSKDNYKQLAKFIEHKLFARIKTILYKSIQESCAHLFNMYDGDMKKAPSIYIDMINMFKCSYESFKEQIQNEYKEILSDEDVF